MAQKEILVVKVISLQSQHNLIVELTKDNYFRTIPIHSASLQWGDEIKEEFLKQIEQNKGYFVQAEHLRTHKRNWVDWIRVIILPMEQEKEMVIIVEQLPIETVKMFTEVFSTAGFLSINEKEALVQSQNSIKPDYDGRKQKTLYIHFIRDDEHDQMFHTLFSDTKLYKEDSEILKIEGKTNQSDVKQIILSKIKAMCPEQKEQKTNPALSELYQMQTKLVHSLK